MREKCANTGFFLVRILYNILFNDFFFFISKTSVHNFADDNTLASFASTLKELLPILESECEAAINWLHNNKMIVNFS